MAIRRSLSLWDLLSGNPNGIISFFDFMDSIFALAISALMLAGVILIPPLFHTIKQAVETLRRARDDLEIQVERRTE